MSHNAESLLAVEQKILSYNGLPLQQVADEQGVKAVSIRNNLQEKYGPSVSIKKGIIAIDPELLHREIEGKINSLAPRAKQKNNKTDESRGLPRNTFNYGKYSDFIDIIKTTIFLDNQRQISEDLLIKRVRQGNNLNIL